MLVSKEPDPLGRGQGRPTLRLREEKRAAIRHREAVAAAERDLNTKEAMFMAGAKTDAQRAEIAQWVNSYRRDGRGIDLKRSD